MNRVLDLFSGIGVAGHGNSAEVSTCGRYRYRLDRHVGGSGEVYAFFGVNPSTADASSDDATVRKWNGFCRRWGASRFVVGNLFAYRATDVRELANAPDPHGPRNSDALEEIIEDADVLVPCWGASSKMPRNLRGATSTLLSLLLANGKEVRCFGGTAGGDPRHPLMLSYSTPLVRPDALTGMEDPRAPPAGGSRV